MNENRFYVYLHRRLDNGKVFYVGKGTGKRLREKSNRSIAWNNIVIENGGFNFEILEDNLTNEQALQLELYYINEYKNDIVNKHENNRIKNISDIKDRYVIDKNSPSGLSKILKNGCLKNVGYISNRYLSKEPAGWFLHVSKGVKVAVHRVILQLNGVLLGPLDIVNHRNCNPLDNRIENLEVCTTSENNRKNRVTLGLSISKLNSSGVTGVLEVTNINKGHSYTYAMCTWSENSKSKSKKFSYNKYGKEMAWKLAIDYREEMITKFYKKGITL